MVTRIAIVAGEILSLLENCENPLSADDLIVLLCEPPEMIYMSIGWLVRRGLLHCYYGEGNRMIYVDCLCKTTGLNF